MERDLKRVQEAQVFLKFVKESNVASITTSSQLFAPCFEQSKLSSIARSCPVVHFIVSIPLTMPYHFKLHPDEGP